jgi:drug/metabolite transporter (DMT)-like permease
MKISLHTSGIGQALLAAVLFGASTPLAKALVGWMSPEVLAGLLYLGAGFGLELWRHLCPATGREAPLQAHDLPWLAGAVVCGGILGPLLLMTGLTLTPASSAVLLLNLEGVFSALLAWWVFRENFDWRIILGMLLIVGGGALLSWSDWRGFGVPWGPLAVTAACLCWALDNNTISL